MSMTATEGRTGNRFNRVADWPAVFERILPPEVWQRFARDVPGSDDPRARWQPKSVVMCWIFMGCVMASTFGERFSQSRGSWAGLFPARRRPGKTYAGLLKRSRKLGVETMRKFLHSLRPTMQRFLTTTWQTFGWTVFAVDGTRIDAPRTRGNQRVLRRAGREKSGPQWSLTALLHMPSRTLWDWRQGPGPDSERGHLREMLGGLPPDALLLGDAGFTGYALMKSLVDQGTDFLIRCGSNVKLLVPKTTTQLQPSRCGWTWVYLWPKDHRDLPPLRLRLIVLLRRRRRMYLLTTVTDDRRMSQTVAAKLYEARWGIEVHYRSLKQTLGRRKLQASGPQAGEWELAANLLALALMRLLAVWRMGDRAPRASVAGLARLLRTALEALRYRASTRGFAAALDRAVGDDYQRRRPKRSRGYPRKKREKPPGAPMMLRLTPHEMAEILRLNTQGSLRVG